MGPSAGSQAGKVMQATILDLQQQLMAKDWLLLQLQVRVYSESWSSTAAYQDVESTEILYAKQNGVPK